MSALGARLAGILGLLAVVGLAYLYVDGLRARLAKAEGEAGAAQTALSESAQTITRLKGLMQEREVAAAKLEGERNAIRDELSKREMLMRKLQDENAEIRAWAAAAVPGPVVRLREHGPITGAAAYRQFMSESSALPATRDPGPD